MRSKFVSLLAVAFSLGVVQAASAADMPDGWKSGRFHDGSANTPITTAPFGAGTITSPADVSGMTDVTASSGAFGGQIGCRWQTPQRWVFGIEGDFDWTNLNGTANAVIVPGGTVFIPTDTFDFRMRWESSVRGNIGYSWDRFLV